MSTDLENQTTKSNGSKSNGEAGLADKLTASFIHSPLAPLLFAGMLALGILGLMITPRQEDPQISVPLVDVFLSFPGASSIEVSNLAIDPLERIMSEIPGVKHVYSASERGQGVVTIRFKVGEKIGESIVKVHDKLNSNLDIMPPGVSRPLVKQKGIDDVPVVTLTLWSDEIDYVTLRKLSNELLQEVKQIQNTGQGSIVGGQFEQINIKIKPERLASLSISLDQIAETISAANSEKNIGYTESNGQHLSVYAGSFLNSANDVANLLITTQQGPTQQDPTQQGRPIFVRDVADVSVKDNELSQYVSYYTGVAYGNPEIKADGLPAVTIAIAKKVGSNGVSVASAILERVEQLKGKLIPDNVHVEVTRNYGVSANEKVNNLLFKLFIATGAVTVLVWYALGFKPSVVVTLVIPVVILCTVFAAYLLEMTVDRVSLFALIFSIGILVDDAIVVVENIYRRWLMDGDMKTSVAIDAVKEVGNPTILATFTVIAALLPMAFVSGLMGPYMAPIPLLGSVAMMISLFAAFAFTPYFAMRIKPSLAQLQESEKKEHEFDAWLGGVYNKVLMPLVNSKTKGFSFLIGLLIAFFLCILLFTSTAVPIKMLPFDDKPEFSVIVDMPEGSPIIETINMTRQIAEQLRGLAEVSAIQTYSGNAKPFDFNGMVRHYYLRSLPWQGEVQVQLVHKNDRDRTSHQIATQARALLQPLLADSNLKLTIVEMPPGPPVTQTVVAEVYAENSEERRQIASDITELFEQHQGLSDVDNYLLMPHDVLRFKVNTDKASRSGVSVENIVRNLSFAFGKTKVGDIKQPGNLEPTYIVMQIPLSIRTNIEQLKDIAIITPQGQAIPLGELGTFSKEPQDPIIYHKDLRPLEYVVGDAVGRLQAPLYPMLDISEQLLAYKTPSGEPIQISYAGVPKVNSAGIEWTGEWTVTYETFRDMGIAFSAALILIYMLVVWQFGNFVLPAIIMAPIPLTLLGIVPGHLIMGAEFTATSMIGFIALAGIIVRNSILLVDFAISKIESGMEVGEAVILSCRSRTRPIVITAFALVGGSSVILTDPIFQGMAVSLLFGVLISTLLTLLVIPLGCISAGSYMKAKSTGVEDE